MKTKSKMKLSSGVLQMKFMKRTAAEEVEEKALEEQKKQIDDEHWYLQLPEQKNQSNKLSVVVEPSYTVFESIGFGRMSFNGFNPQVEKLTNPEEKPSAEPEDDKEIDDDLMAEHYQNTLKRTISNKFGRTNRNNREGKVKRLAK